MAGRTSVEEHRTEKATVAGQQPSSSVALRAALIVAASWAACIFALTLVSLIVDMREYGWQGLTAPTSLGYALAFAAASYLLRFARWHVLATRLAPDLGIRDSFVVNTIGFGLIMTPARAGEILKLLLLRQRTAVPIASSAPIFFMEKLCEAAVLAGLALVSSLFLPWAADVTPAAKLWGAGVAFTALAAVITLRDRLIALAPRLPILGRFLARPRPHEVWSHLAGGTSHILTWPMFLSGLALSSAARLCDGVAIVWVAHLYGLNVPLAAGWFLIGSSGFLGGISMLPGGVGVAEASLIGLFIALGAGPAAAIASALTSRILIFWIWVALGLTLALRDIVHPWRKQRQADPREDDP